MDEKAENYIKQACQIMPALSRIENAHLKTVEELELVSKAAGKERVFLSRCKEVLLGESMPDQFNKRPQIVMAYVQEGIAAGPREANLILEEKQKVLQQIIVDLYGPISTRTP